MPTEAPDSFRRYRAPQENGQALIQPAWFELPAAVNRNRARLAATDCRIFGLSLSEISSRARRQLVEAAMNYTRAYRDIELPHTAFDDRHLLPLVLSGHQPQLYHAGVWYKNFALGALAHRLNGVGIHFLIDSDLCRTSSIRVPAGSPKRPHVETISYDLPDRDVPFEERTIRDRETFESFGRRVAESIAPFVTGPLVRSLWPRVVERSRGDGNLGRCLAQGRHLLEAEMKNVTLELPQSAVCRLPDFYLFVADLLANLPRFQQAYNLSLADYRRAHRLRNHAHPVPDLVGSDDGWLEAPFWLWTEDDPRRRPLFARYRLGKIEVTDREHQNATIDLSRDDAESAVEQLQGLARRGVKIRTRALSTTLFARLVLGDMFLHGIGGAKYDQVTDRVAQRYFGADLPEFAAVSATLRLPIECPSGREVAPALSERMRELRFHPERFLENGLPAEGAMDANCRQLIADKRRWIATPKTPDNARLRHLAIQTANDALERYVRPLRRQWERQLEAQESSRQAAAVLQSREFSFCLQPRDYFERMLLGDLGL